MAKYTVELRDIVNSGENIFDFDYDFYNENERADFEKKFINHFYFREIGVETVARFKHHLMNKFNEILPYYNVLFVTSKIEYDKLNNYNVTEILSRKKDNQRDLTGNAKQTGSTDEVVNVADTKFSNLDSDTSHTEDLNYIKNETQKDSNEINKEVSEIVGDKKVTSDTPSSLLSMEDITNNVYASQADIQDAKTESTDKQTSNASKENEVSEGTTRNTSDIVNATSNEETDTRTTSNIDANSNTDTTQAEIGKETENYELTRVGNIGVMTSTDILEKHIEFQKKMTRILISFFNECSDLFMQIY